MTFKNLAPFSIPLIMALVLIFQPYKSASNANAQSQVSGKKESKFKLSHYEWEDRVYEGMTYRIYFKDSSAEVDRTASLWVINLTKDKLECDKLAAEINQLNKVIK